METLEATDDFVLVNLGRKTQPHMPPIFRLPNLKGHDLFEITVDKLQHLYSSGAFSAIEYTQFCLDRIQRINPYLEAAIETNPDALLIAERLDCERGQGTVRGPLHGVPVLVKDVGDSLQRQSCHSPYSHCAHIATTLVRFHLPFPHCFFPAPRKATRLISSEYGDRGPDANHCWFVGTVGLNLTKGCTYRPSPS